MSEAGTRAGTGTGAAAGTGTVAGTGSETGQGFPRIVAVGLAGVLVQFGDQLEEAANRAALAFCAAVETASPDGVEECSTSLVSVFLRFDPLAVDFDALSGRLQGLLQSRDWYGAALPQGRRFLRIPTLYDAQRAPQLPEVAALAGLSETQAVQELSTARTRVLTIGFAPGMPYLGTLPEHWDIPRQSALTAQLPRAALVVAIRQLVLFPVSTPTGWRQVGQTAARLFDPNGAEAFLLRPGDEVQFPAVSPERFAAIEAGAPKGVLSGGIEVHPL